LVRPNEDAQEAAITRQPINENEIATFLVCMGIRSSFQILQELICRLGRAATNRWQNGICDCEVLLCEGRQWLHTYPYSALFKVVSVARFILRKKVRALWVAVN
jgi:hypothetical protein